MICCEYAWRPMPIPPLKNGDVIEIRGSMTYNPDGTSAGPVNQAWRYKKTDAKTSDIADSCSLYG